MYHLQALNPSHALAIAELWAVGASESANAEQLFTPAISNESHAQLIAQQLAQQARLAWGVLNAEGELLAYITASLHEAESKYAAERYLKIHDLDVAATARRLGLGRQLVQLVRDYVQSENLQAIEVSWILKDQVADAFWRSQGFVPFLQTARSPG